MKIGNLTDIGDVDVKVEVTVQGGIRYPDGTELVKRLKSSIGTNADGFHIVGVESQTVLNKPVTE